ncbi:hypothetical protein BGX38DRAFT_1175936 [Terfezia claveryi]|nr:hypothetical protein BGX38DRAFT_1175936 [Terfezia claveryi]
MRLSRKLGLKWHIHLLAISGTVGYSFGVLQIVLVWCMSGVGLVGGIANNGTNKGIWPYVYDSGITQKYLATLWWKSSRFRTLGPSSPPPPAPLAPPPPLPPPPSPPPPKPPHPPPPPLNLNWPDLDETVNIPLATIGAEIGVLLLGYLIYRLFSEWSILKTDVEPLWPPSDAPRDEIVQLVALIRTGMIDAHGAPLHVINWVVHGVNAPWPPPGGVESLQRRRRWGYRHAATTRTRGGRIGRSNFFTGNANIELPPRTRQHRQSTSRPFSATTVEPLPPYVRDPILDTNHYLITVVPQDFPPLPPELLPSTPEFGPSSEVQRRISSTSNSQFSMNQDGDSEIMTRRTESLQDHDDTPLTGLTPRPPPPVILPPSP